MILKLKELLSFFAKITLIIMLKLLSCLSVDNDGTQPYQNVAVSLTTGFSLRP